MTDETKMTGEADPRLIAFREKVARMDPDWRYTLWVNDRVHSTGAPDSFVDATLELARARQNFTVEWRKIDGDETSAVQERETVTA